MSFKTQQISFSIPWLTYSFCVLYSILNDTIFLPTGHSSELTDGHSQFMQGIKPVIGYNGKYGYRRNSPWLRMEPSPFGTASRSPSH